MAYDVLKLKRWWQSQVSDRAVEEQVWDDIEKFIMPLTGRVAEALYGATTQAKTDVRLWDLTAPLALHHLASALHSDITNPSSMWLDTEWMDAELEKDHDAVVYREEVAKLVWSELQASDFNMEISSGYQGWAGIGNMCLVCEPTSTDPAQWKGLDFTGVDVRQVQWQEDSRGGVWRWARLYRWTAVQIVDYCEREKNEDGTPKYPAPQKYQDLAKKEENSTQKYDVIFCIFRREDEKSEVQGLAAPDRRPWGYRYFTLEDAEGLGEEGGYYKMPVVMARYARRPGSQWGYGIGHLALRHVKGLNYFKELQLNAGEKAVDPAHGMSERVGGQIDLRPGKGNVMPSKDDWWPLESASHFDVSVEILRDERIEIRRAFHEDDLMLKESPQMTATEVQARKDQMNRALGSPVGRLTTDALAPIVEMVIDHLGRAGRLPPDVPPIVRQKKSELKLRFRGPIARAQMMDEVVAIEREAAFISNLLKLGFTDARHYFNLEHAIQEHAKRLGVPMSVLTAPSEAKKAIEDERRAMAAAQAAETAKRAGQAMASMTAAAGQASAVPGLSGPGAPGIDVQPALAPSGGVPA